MYLTTQFSNSVNYFDIHRSCAQNIIFPKTGVNPFYVNIFYLLLDNAAHTLGNLLITLALSARDHLSRSKIVHYVVPVMVTLLDL